MAEVAATIEAMPGPTYPPFDHNRILKRIAGSVLEPAGLSQLGSSRSWVDDHGWWVTLVAFEPSGFGRGTYLRTATCALWHGSIAFQYEWMDRWPLPHGAHGTAFVDARRREWWERDIQWLAEAALDRVEQLRSLP